MDNPKIPLFLLKLWKIVEDPSLAQVVGWDDLGYSFHIYDPFTFCKNVLPQYFKHNNLNSLIRQLNMYGFRKITQIERSGLTRAESDHEHLEFSHPYFARGHPELLVEIKRKLTSTAANVRTMASSGQIMTLSQAQQANDANKTLPQVLDEVRQLRERQSTMDGRLGHVLKANQQLWREMAQMRNLHVKQQNVVNKLLTFLINVIQPSSSRRLGKRSILAIEPTDEPSTSSGSPRKRLHIDQTTMEAIDALKNELHDSNMAMQSGMTITDVTDEMENPDVTITYDDPQTTLTSTMPPSPDQWSTSPSLRRQTSRSPVNAYGHRRGVSPTFRTDFDDYLHGTENSLGAYRKTLMNLPADVPPAMATRATAPSPTHSINHDQLMDLFDSIVEDETNEPLNGSPSNDALLSGAGQSATGKRQHRNRQEVALYHELPNYGSERYTLDTPYNSAANLTQLDGNGLTTPTVRRGNEPPHFPQPIMARTRSGNSVSSPGANVVGRRVVGGKGKGKIVR